MSEGQALTQAPKRRHRRTQAEMGMAAALAPQIQVTGTFVDGKPFTVAAYSIQRSGEFWVFAVPCDRPNFARSRQIRVAEVRDIAIEEPYRPAPPQYAQPPQSPVVTWGHSYPATAQGTYTTNVGGMTTLTTHEFASPPPSTPRLQMSPARQGLRAVETAGGMKTELGDGSVVEGGFIE